MGAAAEANEILKTTPLDAAHRRLGAKMVPFAGYAMPVQYPQGILAEHLHCRDKAGLFDVSHMGQVELIGRDAAAALESLVPGDIQGLPLHRTRYTLFTDEAGGILDDLMATRTDEGLFLVVNAACKEQDFAHLAARIGGRTEVKPRPERALLALQGPKAAAVMARLAPESQSMPFMSARALKVAGIPCSATRSGYTGEDGWEISVANEAAEDLFAKLTAEPDVLPCGLGARDSLRLEAGLCLYGSDIDKNTTPIEAGLSWTIGKRRREEGGFPGAAKILDQLKNGTARKRVGIRPVEKAPARAHTIVRDKAGTDIGEITSGGFSPTLSAPIAMGYVRADAAALGAKVDLIVRDVARAAEIVALPFVAHRYFKTGEK